uniref:Uncharacterized protein n=1 Tax=Hyaloperonospora arabidopsidis (strain Emoy2) TaxID=559515 RepID=M4BL88_HYAAE
MGGAGGSTTEARCGLAIIGTAAAYRVGHRPELAFDPITEFQLETYVSLVGAALNALMLLKRRALCTQPIKALSSS